MPTERTRVEALGAVELRIVSIQTLAYQEELAILLLQTSARIKYYTCGLLPTVTGESRDRYSGNREALTSQIGTGKHHSVVLLQCATGKL